MRILRHIAGHNTRTRFPVPADSSGGKNAIQAIGSTNSYGGRYAVQERLEDRRAERLHNAAMLAMRPDLPLVEKDGQITYEDVFRAQRMTAVD